MKVTIVEVGPRDGLQNESSTVSTADKVAFVDRLSAAGLPVIEVSAFVSPKWVPQMADAADVFAGITRRPGVRYAALVPNLAGLDRAHAAGVSEIAIFAAASETFSLRNINQSIDASLAGYRAVCERAAELGVRVRAYVSTAFGCPFEGHVPPDRVAAVCQALVEMGAFEVSVSDTIGIAHPGQVPIGRRRGGRARAAREGRPPLPRYARDGARQCPDGAATGRVATFDSSAGGLGGCPYAPGATGNLATEDLIYMLDGLGIETGVNLAALVDASAFIESRIGHRLPSRYYRAVKAPTRAALASSRAARARASGAHGFSSTRSHPTSRARSSCARPPCPLRQMTGTCRVDSFPRICRIISKPSMPGSVRSVMTSAGTRVSRSVSASCASPAWITSNDPLRNSAYICRVSE